LRGNLVLARDYAFRSVVLEGISATARLAGTLLWIFTNHFSWLAQNFDAVNESQTNRGTRMIHAPREQVSIALSK
jgi:hypothetical protein